jgi:predicted small lipoprotein YifL
MLRKILSVILLGAFLLGMAACGPKKTDDTGTTTGGTTEQQPQQDDLLNE